MAILHITADKRLCFASPKLPSTTSFIRVTLGETVALSKSNTIRGDKMKTTHKIIIGDSRWIKEVQDESVHLIITSPPYWQLKDYGNGKQIGFNDTYEEYINNLNLVWNECHSILHKSCRLWINIGDQFARSVYYGRYKVVPIRKQRSLSFARVQDLIIWELSSGRKLLPATQPAEQL